MKAVCLNSYGGPDVLHVLDLPDPDAGPGQVRIRVQAAGVNPVDAMLRTGLLAGMFPDARPPFVPGMEVAGTIDQIGPDVHPYENLAIGSDVVAIIDSVGSHGGYSEMVTVPAESVTRAPAGAAPAQRASFLNNALTAQNALDAFALPAGATLLVTGAAGAVGGYAVQLGAHLGLRVVAVAGHDDEDLVRSFGADVVVPRGQDLAVRVRSVVPEGVDAVADAALLHEQVLGAIRDGGQLGTFRSWSGQPERGISVHGLNVPRRATDQPAIARMRELVENGVLDLRVAAIYPFVDAAAAHRRLDHGGLRSRIVLEP